MEKKNLKVWLPLLLSITMIAGIFFGYKMRDGIPGKSFFYLEKRRPVQEIMDLIQHKYVDEVNINALADTAIDAILASLDPHSSFIPASELEQINEDIQGSFFGIGIEFDIFDDTLHVINVLKGGPGDKAGILTGDKFLQANDKQLAGKKVKADSMRKILRGSRGSTVEVTLLRDAAIRKIIITRDMIPVSSIDAAYMLDSTIGYIRLNKFSIQTYREFMLSLTDLKKQGMQKLILDLRGNGGGVLDEAVEIADEFLEGDKLITYTEGRHVPKKEYRCKRLGQFEKGPLVILSDEGSASASEILMGALQDWDRATIIGRRSFGKGLVQEQYDLSDHSALRLTIARYYTPSGRSIQRPYQNGEKAYYEEINDRFTIKDSTTQLIALKDTGKAYTTQSGRKVYAGGGITPDYPVAADTAKLSAAVRDIYLKGLVNIFGYRYYLGNRDIAKRYTKAADFSKSFQLTENDWLAFELLAKKDSVDLALINPADKQFILHALKAAVARQVWRYEGYFEVYNTRDEVIQSAIERLK